MLGALMENDETSDQVENQPREHRPRRRSGSRRHGRRGRLFVWTMTALLVGHWGWRASLTLSDVVHPLAISWQSTGISALVVDGTLTLLGLACLIFLYRGNTPIRFLLGAVSAVAALVFAVLLAWNWTSHGNLFWLAYDGLAFVAYGFAAWTCLLSKQAGRFLASQEK